MTDRAKLCSRWKLLAAIVIGCAISALTTAHVGAQEAGYLIGSQDVLVVSVWDQPNLSGRYPVEGDGTIGFPLLGRIKAAGATLRRLEQKITADLADGIVKNPQVTITIEQYRSQNIFIVGEVRQPGAYPMSSGSMRLIEALARAGATTATASGEVTILRAPPDGAPSGDGADQSEVIRVDLKALHGGALQQNVALRAGDTIFVLAAEVAYVFGQVKNAGSYPIHRDMTVLQTLTLAGGLTPRGSTSRIRIVRTVEGRKEEFKVRLNDLVEPGDTIIVPERFF